MGITFSLKLAAAAAALATAAGLAAAAPAAAETQTHRDPRGDVATSEIDRAAPRPGIDITRVVNTYRARTLSLGLEFADLKRGGYGAQWYIRTDAGTYSLIFDRTEQEPRTIFLEPAGRGAGVGDRGVPPAICEGVEVVRAGDTLTGIVPRRCIESADEVQIAASSFQPRFPQETRYDDSRQKGLRGEFTYGPVLERN